MLDWSRIDTVLLDMDGTLLDLHFDNFFWLEHLPRSYAEHHRLSEQESTARLHEQLDSAVGTLNWYCLDHWSETFGMDLLELKREVRHKISLRPLAVEFLKQLRDSDLDVIMVTNAHRATLDIKMAQVDITHWFDRIVVSHDLRAPKEEQAFWQRLQELHPFDPARTLLVDDTERVLEAAEQYGIAHLLTLLQPDSRQQKRLDTRFRGIHHFDEVMPPAAAT